MDIEKYINDVEEAKRVFNTLDVSAGTRADYSYRIRYFMDFVKGSSFDHNTFLEYKRNLGDRRDISVSTKNKLLISARVWLKELHRRGEIPVDVTANIRVFKQGRKHKKMGLNDEEMARLTEHMKQLPPNPANSRLRAILALLALQGLREVEVIRLDVEDLDFVDEIAHVWGKGLDDKAPIDLNPSTIEALREHMKANKVASGALFMSLSNNRGNGRLTTRALRDIVTQKLRELGIERSTHGFRHWFTTKLIQKYEGNLLRVCEFTRHTGLDMLQVYNDQVLHQADLPRFFECFEDVSF